LTIAALGLLVDDVAEPEMVDKTWRISVGASQGPFQMMDVIGLRTAYNVAAAAPDEKMQAAAALLKERYIDQGKLGRESGEGFNLPRRRIRRLSVGCAPFPPPWRARPHEPGLAVAVGRLRHDGDRAVGFVPSMMKTGRW
jgi:3-hydroxyacyl-CoA dehydrogenase, C-terminal domain